MQKSAENYGDLLGKYLVERISNKPVVFAQPKRWHWRDLFQPIYVTSGSVLAHVNPKCVVWGSGIINANQQVKRATFLAVRGPETRNCLLKQGYEVPEIYGDPGLVMPRFFNPKVEQTHDLGIIPHYVDYDRVKDQFKDDASVIVIDLMTTDIEVTTKTILRCKRIVSSSLHGLIIPHAYGIPAVWYRFSDKLFGDNIKFKDYFRSVGITPYIPEIKQVALSRSVLEAQFNFNDSLPQTDYIRSLQDDLLSVCPFKT
jgi:hypothetical protein